MLIIPGCDCEYCRGQVRLIPYDVMRPLISQAKKDRVTIKSTDLTFAIDGVRAVACVRFIRNRLARLCGCWISPEFRDQGIGKQFVLSRIAFIENHTSANAIDTFAFNSRLYLSLGFESRASFKIGTTLLRKVVNRDG